MRRAKNRRGIFVVVFGILFMALMAAAALSIDFARIWAMRNELQTTADAAALAGAVQIGKPPSNARADIIAEANTFAAKNPAMGVAATVDEITPGKWDDALAPNGFTAEATPYNAVRVKVGHSTNRLIMSALGIAAPTVHATAIAWADAPISETTCIRPWAIPYEVLMGRINQLRDEYKSAPFTRENLTRPFEQADMAILTNATAQQRTFRLKIGQNDNNGNNTKNEVIEGTVVNGQPGNFQAVALPKWWDFTTQAKANPGPNTGGDAYKDAIMGKYCYTLSVGDSLLTESGNMAGPTVQAVDKSNNQTAPYGICDRLTIDVNGKRVGDNHGNCENAAVPGGVGVDIKAAFYYCPSSCAGRSTIGVNLLGSFTLMKVYPDKSNPNAEDSSGNPISFDKSEIVGVFKPIQDDGPVGGTSSTLRKVILVK